MGLEICLTIYTALKPEKKIPAILLLRQKISEQDKQEICKSYEKDPKGWFAWHHHGWGTGIRNLLRENNLGEDHFGICNLDDIYVELVEDAVFPEGVPCRPGCSISGCSGPPAPR